MNSTHTGYALIMAGGQGTRFWPYSTPDRPKQFLPIGSDTSLIAQTWRRLARIVPEDHILVVAHGRYREQTLAALPALRPEHYLAEPEARNTAPCLILAREWVAARDPQAVLLVVPADHCIKDEETFAREMGAAMKRARSGGIITAGLRPTEPHTGYGYIKAETAELDRVDGLPFHAVARFVEKPDLETARAYLDEGGYYWNGGMFVFRVDVFLEELERHAPDHLEGRSALASRIDDPERWGEAFSLLPRQSIDYALMEHSDRVLVCPVTYDWNDVGSWSSVQQLLSSDPNGNTRQGEKIWQDDCHNCLAYSTLDRPLALIGLSDVVVVQTAEGTLVCRQEDLQRVREAQAAFLKPPSERRG